MVRAGLFRKAGLFDEAEGVVRRALDESPDWHKATALGLLLREKGDVPGAEGAFRLALKMDPDDVSARLEAGDMLFNRGQWREALGWYDHALKADAQHKWALPSAQFCRWKLTGDEGHLRAMIELAKAGNQRARAIHHREFWNRLPEPTDATANFIRKFRQSIRDDPKQAPSGEARMTISTLEAPSNYLAFRTEMAALGHDLRLKVEVEKLPEPDTRWPITEVTYLLWDYDGTDAKPGLPPPGTDVVRAVAALAAAPFDEEVNWAAASRVAEELGPARVGEVLAVMVHPPAVPEGKSVLEWLPRVQHAAAQVAAQVDAGWEGSARREALLSVLLGPQDWATAAAIRALARVGREEEAYAPDIHDAFQELADSRPSLGHWGWVRTLFESWQWLPHLYPQEREKMQATLREMDAREQRQG
jgi:tetratricopeptide (TPR) repeat protein